MRKPTSLYLGLLLCLTYPVVGQQPTETTPVASPSQPPATPPEASRASSSSKGKKKPLPFPEVRVRIRQTSEKKFRWETYTNSRGEFAVRLPEGNKYEVQVHAK